MNADRYPKTLFTRQQIGALTGIDSSTLNYWMREGVLRPSSGGAGRGSHRRFAYPEVTLAAMLQELRGFGIAMSALARIASRFHRAFDWMAERGISNDNLNRIHTLYLIRQSIVTHGHWSWTIFRASDEEHLPDVERHRDGRLTWVELDWEQAIAHRLRPRAEPDPDFTRVEEEVALVSTWGDQDFRAYRENSRYYTALTEIALNEPSRDQTADHDLFYRDAGGDWLLASNDVGSEHHVSYIAIDFHLLGYRLWGRTAGEGSGQARHPAPSAHPPLREISGAPPP